MKIQVTQEDIDKGIPKDCSECQVARAIQRCVPGVEFVAVVGHFIRIFFEPLRPIVHILTPGVVSEFINRFDSEPFGLFEPFEFELPLEELLPKSAGL